MKTLFLVLILFEINIQIQTIAQHDDAIDGLPNTELHNQKEIITCTCNRTYHSRMCKNLSSYEIIETPLFQCYKTYDDKKSTMVCLKIEDKSSKLKRKIYSFNFLNCPSPKVPFINIMKNFGVIKTEALTIKLSEKNSSLNFDLFSNLTDLTRLDLSTNQLSFNIEPLLYKLPKLISLNLIGNNVKLNEGVFKSAKELKALELGKNNLTLLQPGVFRNLENLYILNIWENNLTDLTRGLFSDISNLKSLDISLNNITELRRDLFTDLLKLTEIYLYGNSIVYLPEGIFSKNSELVNIRMYGIKTLKIIPSKLFSNLTRLQTVNLSNCSISIVPKDLFWGSKNLKTIRLDENSISILHQEFFKDGAQLVEINLSRNNITDLPNEIFKCTEKLETLNLSHNKLINLTTKLFWPLSSLKTLILNSNKIKVISNDAFLHNTEMIRMDLSSNLISAIPKNLSFGSMKELDFTDNKISSLEIASVYPFQEGLTIDLSFNNISTVDFSQLDYVLIPSKQEDDTKNSVLTVKLEGNPLHCDCKIYNFVQYLKRERSQKYDSIKNAINILPVNNLYCASPIQLKTKLLPNVSTDELNCVFKENYENGVCKNQCKCFTRPHDLSLEIYCNGISKFILPDFSHKINWENFANYKIELSSTGNFIKQISPASYHDLKNVTKLDLSYNNISEINISHLPPNITVLKLHNNNLGFLHPKSTQVTCELTSLKEITLHNNPWRCDCSAEELLYFIQKHSQKILKQEDMRCFDGRPVLGLKIHDICPERNYMFQGYFFGLSLLFVIVTIFILLYFRYEEEIKVWCYANGMFLSLVKENDLDGDKKYDAFICYSDCDEEFVMNHLRPNLENNEPKFKLCLDIRDWFVGDFQSTCIVDSVSNSRRTIVVVSPSFRDNLWGRMGFRTAHAQALEEGKARVIIILYGDIEIAENLDSELKAYIKMNTYVRWGDPWFWEKLRYYLPHVKDANKQKTWLPNVFKINS